MSSTVAPTGRDAPALPASPVPPPPGPDTTPDAEPDTLPSLRAEIDAIDDAMHDLLMRRAGVVKRVSLLGARVKVPFRPGREAAIIRRLLGRHTGPLPARALGRLWREIYASFIAIETPFTIAVCDGSTGGAYAAAAHEHFGALTPLRIHRTPAQAIREVSAGVATAAVLPMPVEEESPAAAWWTALLHRDEPRIHIVARLPFWASPRPEGATPAQALVVATSAPDPSGQDRSLLGLEVPPEMSRARLAAALAAAGIVPGGILLRRDAAGGVAHGLVDFSGAMSDQDPRLAAIAAARLRPVVLGGYALPVEFPAP